jgi:hypothetical protein
MPTIGLVVEGEDDKAAIPVLIRRSRKGVKVVTRQCRGSVTAGKLRGILLRSAYHSDRLACRQKDRTRRGRRRSARRA